jgi:hypothetical protein
MFAVHCAIRKYGWENLRWEIVYKDVSEKCLDQLEIDTIAWFNFFGKDGYNLNAGGNAPDPSLSTLAKMSAIVTSLWQDEEYRQKNIDACNRWRSTPESRITLSAAQASVISRPGVRENLRDKALAQQERMRHDTEAIKAKHNKCVEAGKRSGEVRRKSPAHRQPLKQSTKDKIAAKAVGRHHVEETKDILRKRNAEQFADPVRAGRHSDACAKAAEREEVKVNKKAGYERRKAETLAKRKSMDWESCVC